MASRAGGIVGSVPRLLAQYSTTTSDLGTLAATQADQTLASAGSVLIVGVLGPDGIIADTVTQRDGTLITQRDGTQVTVALRHRRLSHLETAAPG